MLGKSHTDIAKVRMGEVKLGEKNPMFGKIHTDATKVKMSEATSGENNPMSGKTPSPEACKKNSEANSGENHYNYGKPAYNRGVPNPPEVCKKISESNKKAWLDKQWYGTVTYGKLPRCVLFNAEFKERCRAYWGYKSVLLPHKTQAENCVIAGKPARLTVHHVYYQIKALCGYDEDLQGYYAMVNLGTERKPNLVRHNIKGDPNKFVTLTHSENVKANSNKLTWIKKFEDMIEAGGGKCYFTEEEMVEYKSRAKNK